jgi:hypothetical protein
MALCDRCHCCSSVSESAPCWSCGGFEPEWDDDWDDGWCNVCQGEGEIYFMACVGNCDENGKHKEQHGE